MNNRKLDFKGTHKEIGEQIGNQYKTWGKKEVYVPPFVDDYYHKQLAIYQKYFPAYIDLLEGVSEGLAIPKDLVLQSYLTGFLHVAHHPQKANNKCSTFAVKNDTGVFIGRNYDWLEASEKDSKLLTFEYSDNSANNITGISDMGTWKLGHKVNQGEFVLMTEDAWNTKGLYINLSGAPGEKRTYGISTPHLVQLIAEQCITTEEAIALLSDIPIPEPKIFTVADKEGNFAVVERQIGKEAKVRTAKNYMIVTNHYQHPDLLLDNEEIFRTVPFHSTFGRYQYLELMLLKEIENINLNNIFSILDKPPVLQNWRGKENGDVLTIWECALNLVKNEYAVQFTPLLDSKETIKNYPTKIVL